MWAWVTRLRNDPEGRAPRKRRESDERDGADGAWRNHAHDAVLVPARERDVEAWVSRLDRTQDRALGADRKRRVDIPWSQGDDRRVSPDVSRAVEGGPLQRVAFVCRRPCGDDCRRAGDLDDWSCCVPGGPDEMVGAEFAAAVVEQSLLVAALTECIARCGGLVTPSSLSRSITAGLSVISTTTRKELNRNSTASMWIRLETRRIGGALMRELAHSSGIRQFVCAPRRRSGRGRPGVSTRGMGS